MSYESDPPNNPVAPYSDSTNKNLLVSLPRSALGPYLQSPDVMHCPGDKSYIEIAVSRLPRVRSYSMNHLIGDWRESGSPSARTRGSIRNRAFLLIEEHDDTIRDPYFVFGPHSTFPPANYAFTELPSARHRGSGVLSFTDGSVEVRKWEDPRILKKVLRVRQGGASTPNGADAAWLARQNVR